MKFSEHLGKGAWAFARNVLPLIYAVAIILVARTIPVAEYGTLVVFQALFSMLFQFSDGFALQAIVKFGVEPHVNMEELVTVTAALFVAFIGVALTIMLILRDQVSALMNMPQLVELLPWLAIFTLLTMPRVVFSKVLQSNFRMKEIFFIDFSNFGVAAIAVFYLLSQHKIGSAQDVIRITVATGLLSSIVAGILVRPYLSFRMRYSREMLSRISYFVRYQAAMGLTSAFQQNFDTLVVAPFTNASGVAIYAGAKQLLRGFDVIRETMTLFVFPAASKYYSRGEISTLRSIVEKSTSLLYLALLPIGIVLELLAPTVFHLLYGTKFDASIPLFRILLLVLIAFPVQMVFATTLSGMGKIKEMFRFFAIGLAVNAIVAVVLLSTIGISGAAIAFVCAGATIATQMFFYMRKHVGFTTKHLLTRGLWDGVGLVRSRVRARS